MEDHEVRIMLTVSGKVMTGWALYIIDPDGVVRFIDAQEVGPFDTLIDVMYVIVRRALRDIALVAPLR